MFEWSGTCLWENCWSPMPLHIAIHSSWRFWWHCILVVVIFILNFAFLVHVLVDLFWRAYKAEGVYTTTSLSFWQHYQCWSSASVQVAPVPVCVIPVSRSLTLNFHNYHLDIAWSSVSGEVKVFFSYCGWLGCVLFRGVAVGPLGMAGGHHIGIGF